MEMMELETRNARNCLFSFYDEEEKSNTDPNYQSSKELIKVLEWILKSSKNGYKFNDKYLFAVFNDKKLSILHMMAIPGLKSISFQSIVELLLWVKKLLSKKYFLSFFHQYIYKWISQ
jgi:hypothetical protein